MTRDDVIRLANEAGIDYSFGMELERFADLVAAHEREECAKVCEKVTISWMERKYNEGCLDCAAAIRARSA